MNHDNPSGAATVTAPVTPISIALVDDHDLVREGLKEIIEANDDLVVVGEAGDSAGAVAVAAGLRPEVVLLDVEIPGDEVTATVGRIREVSPRSQVIILSMHDGPHLLRSLLDVGVKGYLLKSVSREELLSAIRCTRANDGRVLLSVSSSSLRAVTPGSATARLSERECEVLRLAAEALSNAQIGRRLGLAEATVKRHLSNIYVKLDAVSRIDAVNKAVAAAMIAAPKHLGQGVSGAAASAGGAVRRARAGKASRAGHRHVR